MIFILIATATARYTGVCLWFFSVQGNTVNATVTAPAGVRKVEAFPITCNSIPSSIADEDIARVQIGNFVNQSASTQVASNPDSNKTYSNF